MTVPGEPKEEFRHIAHAPGLKTLACVVIMSGGTEAATYCLDNVEFRPSEEP